MTHAPGKTYLAWFNIVSDTFNHHKNLYNAKSLKGASHGDELSYIFANVFGDLPAGEDSVELTNVRKIVDLLYGFGTEGSQYCEKISWNPIQKEELPHNYKALLIDEEPTWKVGKIKDFERLQTWDQLYPSNELY